MDRDLRVRALHATPVLPPGVKLPSPLRRGSAKSRRIVGVFAAVGVLIQAVILISVQPADAGPACDHLGMCGEVINYTDRPMLVAEFKGRQWCVRDSGDKLRCTTTTLRAGEDAGGIRGKPKDVDGVAFARTGFYYVGRPFSEYYVAPNRYLKISDGQRLRCTQPGPVATPRCTRF